MRLADRLTVLRIRVDLGEIRTAAAFKRELERDGLFTLDDPRVRNACNTAGLTAWIAPTDSAT
jgi:hypothetical protein